MNPDQLASALLILACIAAIAIGAAMQAINAISRRDHQMRTEFAGLYRDQAEHDAWVKTGLTDYTPGDTPVFDQMCLERLDEQLGDIA